MTVSKAIRSATFHSRSNKGQVIVESAAMFAVLITAVVLLILLAINTYVVGSYNVRLQAAASNAARNIVAQKWWMGMERPEYNEADATADALNTLNLELEAMGLPHAEGFKPTFTREIMLREKAITLVRVDFNVTLGGKSGCILPTSVPLHISSISSDAEYAVTTHGRALILCGPKGGPQTGIRVPVYNATIGKQTPAHPTMLVAGNTPGESPTAHLVLYCNSAGSTIQKHKDIAQNVTVPSGELVHWAPAGR